MSLAVNLMFFVGVQARSDNLMKSFETVRMCYMMSLPLLSKISLRARCEFSEEATTVPNQEPHVCETLTSHGARGMLLQPSSMYTH